MGRSLLVGGQDMGDFILMLIKGIVYIQNRAARVSEHRIDALLSQALDYNFCSC